MNALFNRWLPCLTLATWSAVLLSIHLTGRVKDFLAPPFRPLVLIAGIVLAIMAVIFATTRADASCCSSAECGHSLSRLASGRILTFLILLVPMLVAVSFSPESFGKTAIENRGITDDYASLGLSNRKIGPAADLPLPTAVPAPEPATPSDSTGAMPAPADASSASTQPPSPAQPAVTDYLTRTPEGLIVAEVLDLLYAAQDNVLRADFEGKDVQLIGQLMPDPASGATGKRFKAVRMFMYCCAADSRPIATLVEVDQLPDLPEMTWIKVTGKPSFPLENGRRVSVLQASKVEKTEPPEEAMLY